MVNGKGAVTVDDWVRRNPPDRPLGYTPDRLRIRLAEEWPAFAAFMAGRAFLSEELAAGEFLPVIHIDDVVRFLVTTSGSEALAEAAVTVASPAPEGPATSIRSAEDELDAVTVTRARLRILHLQIAAIVSAGGAAAALLAREAVRALSR
jgi:hypothetical protein